MRHDDLLAELVAVLASDHTEAIVLAGSTVRGDATPYSDLDLAHIVDEGHSGPDKQYHYRLPAFGPRLQPGNTGQT